MIDISELEPSDVLRVLYDAAKPQGLGILCHTQGPMSQEEATRFLEEGKYFDYVKGRVMKVCIDGTELDERLYDRDNGPGAAASAIESLR